MLSNVCVCNQRRENRVSWGREFQQKDRSFPPRVIIKRRRCFGEVPKNDSVGESEWISSGSPSDTSSVYSPCGCNEGTQGTFSRSGLSSDGEENTEDKVQCSTSQQSVSTNWSLKNSEDRSGNIAGNIPLQLLCRESKFDNGATIACGILVDSFRELPTLERVRSSAVELKRIKRPGGKFLSDNHFYLQHATGEWERVTIESWNPWNGTWQVRGEDEKTFSAAPIALKNEEEYVFLSRKRSFKPRSFGSFTD